MKNKIFLIEDHLQAYYTWKKLNVKKTTLVHFDAHLDFGFQEIKDPLQSIKEAKSVNDLKSHLEKLVLFEKLKLKKEKLTNIGNYIYPAMREGMIKDFYWVVPGDKKEFRKCLPVFKKMLVNFKKIDPCQQNKPRVKKGIIESTLYGHCFFICCLENLPKIKEEVLLDIDVDFLVIDSIRNAVATQKISQRKIWIEPRELISKIPNWSIATISYSVNGGFTPLKFKYLGDKIAAELKGKEFKMPAAAKTWLEFEKTKQQKNYREAIKNDKTYLVEDNNYGPLYLQKKKYKLAEKEFQKIIFCDPKNKFALAGLAQTFLAQKKLKIAKNYFEKTLKIERDFYSALTGLAEIEIKFRKYQRAKKLLLLAQKKEPMQNKTHYLLSLIYRREKKFALAKQEEHRAETLGYKRLGGKRRDK